MIAVPSPLRLRLSSEFYDLPVIMFTAMSGEQDACQAIYAGAQDFVSKPFEPASLVARVRRIFRLRADRPRHVDLKSAVFHDTRRVLVPEGGNRRMI